MQTSLDEMSLSSPLPLTTNAPTSTQSHTLNEKHKHRKIKPCLSILTQDFPPLFSETAGGNVMSDPVSTQTSLILMGNVCALVIDGIIAKMQCLITDDDKNVLMCFESSHPAL